MFVGTDYDRPNENSGAFEATQVTVLQRCLENLSHLLFQYYCVDWAITATVFAGIFLLGDKKRIGFAIGMVSAILSLVFSFQIKSIANGVTSAVLFGLYLRGFLKWRPA
jgi:hypothetical protein